MHVCAHRGKGKPCDVLQTDILVALVPSWHQLARMASDTTNLIQAKSATFPPHRTQVSPSSALSDVT